MPCILHPGSTCISAKGKASTFPTSTRTRLGPCAPVPPCVFCFPFPPSPPPSWDPSHPSAPLTERSILLRPEGVDTGSSYLPVNKGKVCLPHAHTANPTRTTVSAFHSRVHRCAGCRRAACGLRSGECWCGTPAWATTDVGDHDALTVTNTAITPISDSPDHTHHLVTDTHLNKYRHTATSCSLFNRSSAAMEPKRSPARSLGPRNALGLAVVLRSQGICSGN